MQKKLRQGVAGNVRTDIESIRDLLKRPLAGESRPRAGQNQEGPRARHARGRVAQRLRGVVVDGRSDCLAQTSAFSDAEMSLVCSRSLTSRDRLCGGRCASPAVASLRIASAVRLSCASGAVGCFPTANRFASRLGRGGDLKYSALFCDARNCFIFASATPTGAGTQLGRR